MEIQTLPLPVSDAPKNIHRLTVRVHRSSGFEAGSDADNLRWTDVPSGHSGPLYSGSLPVNLSLTWQTEGTVFIRSTLPLPLTLISMTLTVQVR